MISFWRSIQRIDFQVSREKIGAAGSVILGTPVFMLLALVGYAYVSLSNPINVEVERTPARVSTRENFAGSQVRKFVGMTGPGEGPSRSSATDLDRLRATESVMSLNCLARSVDGLSPRVQDDLAEVKLKLLTPVWSEAWGNISVFSDWVRGRSQEDPDPQAKAVFSKMHEIC